MYITSMTPRQFYNACTHFHFESGKSRGFMWGPYCGTTIYEGLYSNGPVIVDGDEMYVEEWRGPKMTKALIRVDGKTYGAVNHYPDSDYGDYRDSDFEWIEEPTEKVRTLLMLYV